MRLASLCIAGTAKLCKAAERAGETQCCPIATTVLPALGHCAKGEMAPRLDALLRHRLSIALPTTGVCKLHTCTFSASTVVPTEAGLDVHTATRTRGQGRSLLESAQSEALRFALQRCCGYRPGSLLPVAVPNGADGRHCKAEAKRSEAALLLTGTGAIYTF